MYKHDSPGSPNTVPTLLIGEKEVSLEEAFEKDVHQIDQLPNIYPYQSTPFVSTVASPSFVTMASSSQECSLITPPDTPSPLTNHFSELFGAPRRCSSREHKQTEFFRDIEPENPRKRRRNVVDGTSKTTSRRMLEFNQSEPVEPRNDDDLVPKAFLDNIQEELVDSPQEAVMEKQLIDTVEGSPERDDVVVNNEADFPISSLVWGKLKGFDWWPGRISSHMEIGGSEPLPDGTLWVKWFGENQVSEMSIVTLSEFGCFAEHFTPAKLRGVYKKAVIHALKEAARRCGKEFVGKHDDKALRSYNINLLEQGSMRSEILEEASEMLKEIDQASLPDDGDFTVHINANLLNGNSTSDAQCTDIATDDTKADAGGKRQHRKKKRKMQRRNIREKNLVYLTQLEKEMLDWGINGFLPMGPASFQPTETKFYPVVTAVNSGVVIEPVSTAIATTASGPSVPAVKEKTVASTVNGAANAITGAGGAVTKSIQYNIMSGRANRENFTAVSEGRLKISDVCISCGNISVVASHPLFQGGLCRKCKESFMECVYLFDDDGSQMYCTICCGGDEVFMCDAQNCSKVYCGLCIERLCGKEELERVQQAETWECYLCSHENFKLGLLCKRDNWLDMLRDLFSNDYEVEYDPPEFISPIPAEERKPIRVLALFDGIATGMQVLKELGIEVDVYISSEIDQDAVKVVCVKHKEAMHVGDIELITENQVLEWGPFDLVLGGSPCNDLSIVNPARKGIYEGTGRLFFEFFRILSYAKPRPDQKRPFFWLFENVVSMKAQDKQTISRFLQCNPVIVDAKDISAAHRARYFWGNLPGMNRPPVPLPGDRLTLQQCLEDNCKRKAQFIKMRTITTKMNSVKQTKKAIMPVYMDGEGGDVLWCTEMERLFGFPDHYTDVANLGRCGRQRLLGKAWSIPVIRHLLSPLKDFFKSSTQLPSHATDHRC